MGDGLRERGDQARLAGSAISPGTAATRRIGPGSPDFNDDYIAAMTHFGMKPRTTAIGEKEQNCDVEASNGALKRRLEQALLLRGDPDFEAVEIYESCKVFPRASGDGL